jgi:hypothetical protein
MPEIVTGKNNIMVWMRQHFSVHSWLTIRRWRRKGMPVRYLESHAPFIIPSEIISWAVKFDELTKKDLKK